MTMDKESVRQYIVERGHEHFQRDRSGHGYICPICRSGSGKHGTGITTKDGQHYTCWQGCFSNASVIDVIGLEQGLTSAIELEQGLANYDALLQAAADEYGITIDWQAPTKGVKKVKEKQAAPETDYTDFFLQAHANIDNTDYHRGLTRATLDRFKVGFVGEWRHPKAPKMALSPRLIIPTSRYSYIARYAGAGDFINYRGERENKSKVGNVRIFNKKALYNADQPLFCVEGEIDALSIIDVGGEALALGGTGKWKALVEMVRNKRPSQPLIICMDNDAAGSAANNEIAQALETAGIAFIVADVAGPYKDANEALNADRNAFKGRVDAAREKAANMEAEALEAEREALRLEAAAYTLPDFLQSIEESKKAPFYPTGFPALDSILDGGLYSGLYIIGAISSLGKTTFCLHVADNIAAAGHDVLIFSLEMARNELIAKSVSRLTFQLDQEQYKSTTHAKTTRGIMTGTRYDHYSQIEKKLIQQAVNSYEQYAKNIYITEGVGNVGIAEIREKVQKHIKVTGKRPIVLLDYLQIIAPADIRATDKQNTDKAVLELKRLSRDYNIPIIGISSFNRENYTAPVSMTAFKESGAIEYSSDVLIGLQYYGMDYMEGENDKLRDKRVREIMKKAMAAGKSGRSQLIEVKILKNRNGSKGACLLDYYPAFNCFETTTQEQLDKEESDSDTGNGWNVCKGTDRKGKSKRQPEPEPEQLPEAEPEPEPEQLPIEIELEGDYDDGLPF